MPLENSVDDTPLTFDSPELWKPDAPAPSASSVEDTSGDAKPPASSPEAATVPPVDHTPPDAKPRDAGPIPFERHEAILKAERQQRTDLEAKWKRVEWASKLADEGHTPEAIQRALAIHGGMVGNTEAFLEQLLTEAAGVPSLKAKVQALAARLYAEPKPSSATDDAEPQPDLFQNNGDGSQTLVMSWKRQQEWNAWQQRQQSRQLDERFAPLEQVRQQIEREKAEHEAQKRDDAEIQHHKDAGQSRLDELKKEPYYSPEFLKAMQDFAKSVNFNTTVDAAWLHVLRTSTLPKLSETERAKTIADLRTQAVSSSVNPKGAVSGVSTGPKDFYHKSLKW